MAIPFAGTLTRFAEKLVAPKKSGVLVPWPGPVSSTQQQLTLTYQQVTLADWTAAIRAAQTVTNPRRYLLMRLYRGIINDPHLASCLDSRILRTMARPFMIVDDAGVEVPEATAYFQRPWFRKAMRLLLESPHYGFSLVEIEGFRNSAPTDVRLIVRDYVQPENGLVFEQPGAPDGMDFKAEPLADWCFYAGDTHDLGTLLDVAPFVIMKRMALGFWTNHAQIFGMPFRKGHTDITDPAQVENMKAMLSQMGSAAWGVFNATDTIEFIEAKGGDPFKIYLELQNYCDQQISKRLLGGTGTTDEKAFAGSSQVHDRNLDSLATADSLMLASVVNEQLLPLLTRQGIDFTGLQFKFDTEERVDLPTRFSWVQGLLNAGKNVPNEYIAEVFGIEVEDGQAARPQGFDLPEPPDSAAVQKAEKEPQEPQGDEQDDGDEDGE